jgi:hypothetical protein
MRTLFILFFVLSWVMASAQDSLFTNAEGPPSPEEDNPVELGMVFMPRVNGTITHFRFYKTVANDAGEFTLNLWNAYGTNAVRQKASAPGKSGWVRVSLTTPARVSAGSYYVVSVYFPKGRYGGRTGVFTSARTRGNLIAPSSAQAGGNGRYRYGSATGFPTNTYNNSSYYVDVVFLPERQPLIVNAGRDTIIYSGTDGLVPDYQLHGKVSGDGVTFSWRKEGMEWLQDTMLNANTLNPTLRNLAAMTYTFVLRGVDQWGTVSENRVTLDVRINPRRVVFTLMKNGQPFAELFQDGTWHEIGTTSDAGQWFFLGSDHPGFEDDTLVQPPN